MKTLAHVYHRRPTKVTITVERDYGENVAHDWRELELEVSGTVTPGEAPCDGMQWRQTGRGPMPSEGCDASVDLDAETLGLLWPGEVEKAKEALLEKFDDERRGR